MPLNILKWTFVLIKWTYFGQMDRSAPLCACQYVFSDAVSKIDDKGIYLILLFL